MYGYVENSKSVCCDPLTVATELNQLTAVRVGWPRWTMLFAWHCCQVPQRHFHHLNKKSTRMRKNFAIDFCVKLGQKHVFWLFFFNWNHVLIWKMLCLILKSLKNVQTYMQKSNFCDYLIEVPLSISSTTFQQNIGIFRYLATVRPDPLSPLPITHSSPPPPHHDHSNISRHCQQLPEQGPLIQRFIC